jgi:hypothetical protein
MSEQQGVTQAATYEAAKAMTDTLNPHLGGQQREDEISALCEEGMPQALAAAYPAIRDQVLGEVRAALTDLGAHRAVAKAAMKEIKSNPTFRHEEEWAIFTSVVKARLATLAPSEDTTEGAPGRKMRPTTCDARPGEYCDVCETGFGHFRLLSPEEERADEGSGAPLPEEWPESIVIQRFEQDDPIRPHRYVVLDGTQSTDFSNCHRYAPQPLPEGEKCEGCWHCREIDGMRPEECCVCGTGKKPLPEAPRCGGELVPRAPVLEAMQIVRGMKSVGPTELTRLRELLSTALFMNGEQPEAESVDGEEPTYPLGGAPVALDDGADSYAPEQSYTEEGKTNG